MYLCKDSCEIVTVDQSISVCTLIIVCGVVRFIGSRSYLSASAANLWMMGECRGHLEQERTDWREYQSNDLRGREARRKTVRDMFKIMDGQRASVRTDRAGGALQREELQSREQ